MKPSTPQEQGKSKQDIDISGLVTNDLEKRIVEAFETFDHVGNKTVDVREVGTIIRSLGCVPTEAEIQEVIVSVEDQENSGTVPLARFLPHLAAIISEYRHELEDSASANKRPWKIAIHVGGTTGRGSLPLSTGKLGFRTYFVQKVMQGASAEELLKAFQTLDKDKTGYLEWVEVARMLTEVGEPFTKDELEEMMPVAVEQDTGSINYEYYINQIMID